MGLFFFQIFFCQLDVIVAVVFVVIVEVVLSSSNIKHNEVIYIWCHFFCVIARGEREREREVLHDIIPTMEKLRDTSVGLYTTTTSTLFAL